MQNSSIYDIIQLTPNKENSMYKARTVANKLLSLAESKPDTLTPMQVMKLVYLCHGWMLGLQGRQLITESIEAWKYGPVIPDLYQATKDFKSNAVKGPLPGAENVMFNAVEESLITDVYDKYGKYSGPQLSALTHMDGSPWSITWEKYGRSAIVSNDLIEEYFRRISQPPALHAV